MPAAALDALDVDRYPIANTGAPAAREFATQCKAQFDETGLCELPALVRAPAVARIAAEAESLRRAAWFCDGTHNVWLNDAAATPTEARQEHTFVGSVAFDQIPETSLLRAIYQWDPLKTFISRVLGISPLYRFADPLGALSITVFVEGGEHGWHYDESPFTVTMMVQQADSGGAFEYVPGLRGHEYEQQLVAAVLDGDRSRVRTLSFTPGTLLLFAGNRSLHRVTRVRGETARFVPVLCFSAMPDSVNSEAVRELFWGRTGA